jgi:hypothetical protein
VHLIFGAVDNPGKGGPFLFYHGMGATPCSDVPGSRFSTLPITPRSVGLGRSPPRSPSIPHDRAPAGIPPAGAFLCVSDAAGAPWMRLFKEASGQVAPPQAPRSTGSIRDPAAPRASRRHQIRLFSHSAK